MKEFCHKPNGTERWEQASGEKNQWHQKRESGEEEEECQSELPSSGDEDDGDDHGRWKARFPREEEFSLARIAHLRGPRWSRGSCVCYSLESGTSVLANGVPTCSKFVPVSSV